MHAGVVVPRQEASRHPLTPPGFGKRERHEDRLARLGLHHGPMLVCVAMRVLASGRSRVLRAAAVVIIRVGVPVFRMVGMVLVPGVGRLDRLDVHMDVREEIVFEVVTGRLASGHELVREPAGVPDDQRHRPPGGDPQRVRRERLLVQRDLDP